MAASLGSEAGEGKQDDVEKPLAHIRVSGTESAGQDNTGCFAGSGIIVSMQNLNMGSQVAVFAL
jgi:hypothetical protein